MITPMYKVHIVTQRHNRDRLLDALGHLGVVHVEPVDPARALPKECTVHAIATLDHALQVLQQVVPAGNAPDLSPLDAAREVLLNHKRLADEEEHLNSLHRKADQLTLWGNVELRQLEQLRSAGMEIRFFSITQEGLAAVAAECVEVVAEPPGREVVIAVIDRTGAFQPPAGAKEISWPDTDLATVKKEAAQADASIRQCRKLLAELANLSEAMNDHLKQCRQDAEVCIVENSGLASDTCFALQGWMPSSKADSLSESLARQSIPAAVNVLPAEEQDQPPTLIEYPRWAIPIKALFDMLGTLPGYEEDDVSPFFMVALPLFAAMLIGDAGYGIILAGAGLLFYRRIVRLAGKPSAHLLIIFGLATMLWGILTATYFGITPETLVNAGRDQAANMMRAVAPLWRSDGEEARALLMKVSLIIGCAHLVLAHLFTAIRLFPDSRAYAEIAWMAILIAMLFVIWYLMFVGVEQMPAAIALVLLAGFLAAGWFTAPMRNPLKRLLTGLASSILPLLGTFSDIMSYIRLFAVGLASYYIASAFNGLGGKVAGSATWMAGAPIVLFGHALNIGLAAIAIFAHGVRLNMLEFSNNAGIKWAGYAYRPFRIEEDTSIGEKKS